MVGAGIRVYRSAGSFLEAGTICKKCDKQMTLSVSGATV